MDAGQTPVRSHNTRSCLICAVVVACRGLFESLYLRKLRYSQELDGPSCVGFLEPLTTQGAMQVGLIQACAVTVGSRVVA